MVMFENCLKRSRQKESSGFQREEGGLDRTKKENLGTRVPMIILIMMIVMMIMIMIFYLKPGHQSTRGSQSGLHTRCPLTRHPGRILNNE